MANTHRQWNRNWNRMALAVMGACLITAGLTSTALGVAGTSRIALAGSAVSQEEGWPQGVADFLNQPARTNGWNDWFSEWPNDVNQYELHPRTMDEVNQLIKRFLRIESDDLQVILTVLEEPGGYGWVSRLPAGNGIPMMFTIGNQQRLDQWYAHLEGRKFGVMEFEQAPVAVPPSLTIYVGNKLIGLDQLIIPDKIAVRQGDLPRVFHQWNTKASQQKQPPPEPSPVDPVIQARMDAIKTYIQRRTPAEDSES